MPKSITITVYSFKELIKMETHAVSPTDKKQTAAAVKKARQWLIKGATNHDWWDYQYELWSNALDQIGFTNAKISFSGFWSQGDGASFTSEVDVERICSFLSQDIKPNKCISPVEDSTVFRIPARGLPGTPGIPLLFGHDEDFRPWIMHQIGSTHTDPQYRHLAKNPDFIDASVTRSDSRYSHLHTCEVKADFTDDGHYKPGTNEWQPDHPRLHALFENWREDVEALRRQLCQAIYKSLEEEYNHITSDEQLIEDAETNEWSFSAGGSYQIH